MLVATKLQCIRWFLLTRFPERVDHDKTMKSASKEKSNRSKRWYCPTLEEVASNPVPFDTTQGSAALGANLGGKHRVKTLGHDPILGWIFGTANIATSTLTAWDFKSYHINTGSNILDHKIDKMTHRAKTDLVFSHTKRKLFDEGANGKAIIGTSLIKEYKHLKSDIGSHESLPFPIVSTISPKIANTLADYGVDAANVITVGKQVVYAVLINALIGMIHYMCYDPIKDDARNLYEVRTRKIITYSNLISSASNVLWVSINTLLGNTKEMKRVDIGGFLVTLNKLFSDGVFIKQLKEEFITNNFIDLIRGEDVYR